MILSGRRLLLGLSIIIVACGVVILLRPEARWLSAVIVLCGFVAALVLNVFGTSSRPRLPEPDEIAEISAERRAELIRGTSKFLREMKYRYSIRLDTNPTGDRQCFTAEVNTVRLGFIPALVTDNTNDRQGYGFVAFVFDHNRWRGPGLPCPAGQEEAVRHAARCVSPLASEEETKY
jgi:hypothetical protein